MCGVVVHDQVQLDRPALLIDIGGVGASHLLEEGQELLVPVPRLARGGDVPGRDL
jgi:hypothetical protein